MINKIIQNLQDVFEEANRVLEKTDTIKIFSKLGKVEIIGSLRLNLMYRPDIDLLVISEDIDKSRAEAITKELLSVGVFQKVEMIDYQTNPAYDMPLGFYWELIVPYNGKKWKFDIWYLKPSERYINLVHDSIKKFETALSANPEKAEVIFKIKEAYFGGVKYKGEVKGFDIYTAVLENGVNNVEEFMVKYPIQ